MITYPNFYAPSNLGCYGRVISKVELIESTDRYCENPCTKLRLDFEDGSALIVFDDGQNCCEARYMRTDDPINDLVGGRLVDIVLNKAKAVEGTYSCDSHEIEFLDVKTDKGVVSFSCHNEHNGYYGGFSLAIEELP